MSNKEQDLNAPVTLSRADLAAIVSAAVAEANKPYIDPRITAQEEADKAMLRAEMLRGEQEKQARIDACTHRRNDQLQTWNIHAQRHENGQYSIMCGQCPGVWHRSDDPKKQAKYEEMLSHVNFAFTSDVGTRVRG